MCIRDRSSCAKLPGFAHSNLVGDPLQYRGWVLLLQTVTAEPSQSEHRKNKNSASLRGKGAVSPESHW
eukprot:6911569-Prorocentrum_lima.AAC.1